MSGINREPGSGSNANKPTSNHAVEISAYCLDLPCIGANHKCTTSKYRNPSSELNGNASQKCFGLFFTNQVFLSACFVVFTSL